MSRSKALLGWQSQAGTPSGRLIADRPDAYPLTAREEPTTPEQDPDKHRRSRSDHDAPECAITMTCRVYLFDHDARNTHATGLSSDICSAVWSRVASDVSMGRALYWLNFLLRGALSAGMLAACRGRPVPNAQKGPSGVASVTPVSASASASTPPPAASWRPNRIPDWRALGAAEGKRPLVPSFEVTEAVPGGPQTIWLVMPELQLRQALATSRGSHVCTVIPEPARVAVAPRQPAIGVQVDCGQKQPITVEGASVHLPVFGWIEQPFTIAGKLQPLPSDRYLEYDHVSRPTLRSCVVPRADIITCADGSAGFRQGWTGIAIRRSRSWRTRACRPSG